MERRHFIIGSLASFLYACQPAPSGNEGDQLEGDEIEDDDEIAAGVVNPSGFAEAGPMLANSQVKMIALNSNYEQFGNPYFGGTKYDDSGSFTISANITADNIHTKVEGAAFNETSGGYDADVILESIIPATSGSFNANYFSSIVSIVGDFWYTWDVDGPYYHDPQAFVAAEIAVHDYFDYSDSWPDAVKKSYEMTLTGDTLDDGKLVLVNSTIAQGKNGPEQGSFMREIAEDIYNGLNALKASVNDISANLMIKAIKDNLDNYYLARSLSFDCAPVWDLPGIPAYYADLLGRTPNVLDSVNTGFTVIGGLDTPGFNIFAYPVEFTKPDQKYIALDLQNAKSIWAVGTHPVDGYPMPATKIADLSVLNEVLLDDPVTLQYNYSVTGNVPVGQYFIVQEFVVPTQPSKLIQGDMTPFGGNMASTDMVDWIGHNNVTNWYTRSIKYVSYD
jgi:hypothetical protein